MKRLIAAATVCGALGFGAIAIANPALRGHPNLEAANKDLNEADRHISAAQAANEFDLGGHAAKAKELIGMAKVELDKAAHAANRR